MNILGYLQKIGRALMVPVATLPAAAIMMGAGYWIDPMGWGASSPLAAFLIKAGAAIIDNMSILFAVGVAYGMSKDKDGAAALAGLVGFYVLTTLLSPGAVALIQSIPADQVPKAFSKINNQFVGILTGVIAAELYNRFSQVELPKALAFFSGRRLVPIITSFAMIVMAFVLMAVWPVIYNALVQFGMSIKDMGPAGAGIYAFFNRLLIPVGLHHALNSVFWFDVAGINDIPNFLGGAKALAEGKAVLGVTGIYQAGFFPIMMFGLPGAALAIYHTAKTSQKARVASIMVAAGFASFFTGVTEPLEFSFMFVAPLLYVFHAVLTGVSVYLAASMQWIAGFGFSAGLIDMVLSSRNPLAKNWAMLLLQGAAFFAIYYLSFRTAIQWWNLKTPGREDEEGDAADTAAANLQTRSYAPDSLSELAQGYAQAIGGNGNVDHIDACITRLRLSLKDTSLIDEALVKRLGASAVVKLNNQNVQIIVGTKAELIADALREQLKQDMLEKHVLNRTPDPALAPSSKDDFIPPLDLVTKELCLLSPVSGNLLKLEDVPDTAFSSGAVGEGVAIRPSSALVLAPCDGELANIFSTNHAFSIIAEGGAEFIVHIGVDTVKLGGQGFKRLTTPGRPIKAGEPVLEIDLGYLTAHAASIISPVVLSNADEFELYEVRAKGVVEAGKTILFKIRAK